MARTAVIAGTASAVAGSVASHRAAAKHQRQAETEEQQRQAQIDEQAAAAQEAPGATAGGLSAESITRLQQLGDLLKQGLLTEEEFAAQKAKILGT